jgi:hypothetical protein
MASTPNPTTVYQRPEHAVVGHLWRFGLLAALLTAAAGIIIRAIGVALGALPASYVLLQPTRIIAISVLAAIVATGLLAALARWARRPILTFRIIAAVFLAISLLGPLGAGTDDTAGGAPAGGATVAIMLLMHVVAAVIIVCLLTMPRRAVR